MPNPKDRAGVFDRKGVPHTSDHKVTGNDRKRETRTRPNGRVVGNLPKQRSNRLERYVKREPQLAPFSTI